MAERGKPWHVCDDCLEPLAGELFALARRFRIPFDVAKHDRLEAEYESIIKANGYSTKGLSEDQQKRLDELSQQLKAQQAGRLHVNSFSGCGLCDALD